MRQSISTTYIEYEPKNSELHLDQNQNHDSESPPKSFRQYESWKEVPWGFHCRSQWVYKRRKVREDAVPAAQVRTDAEMEFVRSEFIELFDIDQTRPYTPTRRTEAIWAFTELFSPAAATHRYGLEFAPRKWATKSRRLTRRQFERHLRQKEPLGVVGRKFTNFLVIDLDFHEDASLEVFLSQVKAVVESLNGKAACHFAFAEDCSGVHVILIIPPTKLDELHQKVRAWLERLDRKHPELSQLARSAGMKTLAKLEIYPNRSNAIRLPLGRGRKVLCGKKLVNAGDVESYMKWINDPKRDYPSIEMVLETVRSHTTQHVETPIIRFPFEDHCVPESHGQTWKGNLLAWVYDFWLNGNAHGQTLNDHIIVLARWAVAKGHPEWKIRSCIEEFVEYPAIKSSSSRLRRGDMRKVKRVIRDSVRSAINGNGGQSNPRESTKIFQSIAKNIPWVDPLDKMTWNRPRPKVEKVEVGGNWSPVIISELENAFSMNLETSRQFLDEFAGLVQCQEREGNGINSKYLGTWIKLNFPQLKFGKASKRQRLIEMLQELGVVKVIEKGRPSLRQPTTWTLGPVGAAALNVEEKEVEVSQHVETSIIRFPFSVSCPYTCCFDWDELGKVILQSEPEGPFRTLKLHRKHSTDMTASGENSKSRNSVGHELVGRAG